MRVKLITSMTMLDRLKAQWRAEAMHIMQHFRNKRGHRRDGEGYCIDCLAMMTAAQENAYNAGFIAALEQTKRLEDVDAGGI